MRKAKPLAGGDRTWGELTGQVLGFQPERLTEHYELNRIKKASEAEHNRQEAKFHEDLANDVLTGNYGTAKESLGNGRHKILITTCLPGAGKRWMPRWRRLTRVTSGKS